MDSYEDEEGKGAGFPGAGPPPLPPDRQPEGGRPDGPRESWPISRLQHPPDIAAGHGRVPAPAGPVEPPGPHGPADSSGAVPAPSEPAASGGGMAGLSLPYQVAAAVSLALIAAVACTHLAMVFLHVAPSNTVTKQHGEVVDDWVYPEFEQNWKLFAPNPLQQNIAVQVRAQYTAGDGSRRTSDWIDLSAEDGAEIRGNPLPSHLHQNQLRRAWDFYVGSHDTGDSPNGLRGRLSESYIRRIVMLRLERHDLGGPVERIQLRASTRSIEAPRWSDEKIDTRPVHRELPWWTVTAADLPGGVDSKDRATGRTEAAR
ncbi:hypothetical protein QFZ68_003641 [Streptomyces sp. V1I6]|nr:DUF5819 family protein [Streptomyces sp. V1I6]MDQ0843961.1 hypothetical protein [Streptomyces sp. V1I6]